MRTLLLNKGYMPLRNVSWKKAFCLIFSGRAEVVETYDKYVKTPNDFYFIPAVIRLYNFDGMPVTKANFSKRAVWIRDDYICQYCGAKLNTSSATIDHIVPKCKGGQTTWNNVTTACSPCNNKKGDRMLGDCHLFLLSNPDRPNRLVNLGKIENIWKDYIPKGML